MRWNSFALAVLMTTVMTIILSIVLPHFNLQMTPLYALVLFVASFPIKIGNDAFCLWGAKNEMGSVFSVFCVYVDAKEDSFSFIALLFGGNAGQSIVNVFGIACGKAGQDILSAFGIVFGHAGQDICSVLGIACGNAGREIGTLIGISIGKAGKSVSGFVVLRGSGIEIIW